MVFRGFTKAGQGSGCHQKNINILLAIYFLRCITALPLLRSSSSIQGERIADNLCIDDSYLNDLLSLRISTLAPDMLISGKSPHHYLSVPFYPLVHHCITPDFWPQTYRPNKKFRLSGFRRFIGILSKLFGGEESCGFLFTIAGFSRCGSL